MTAGDRAIRSIVVVGGGIVGLSAALAFARALPRAEIRILHTPPDPSAMAEALPSTLPSVHRFHSTIGLDELELIGAGVALHRLGTRFDRWSASGKSWFHGFGEHGLKAGAIPFHQLWLRARGEGRAARFEAYSAAAALAAADRFAHPAEDPASPLSTYLYGLNLDPGAYHARLEQAAAGLARVKGAIVEIERRDEGGVAALILDDGRRIAADLYLDCSGPGGEVLSRVDDRFEDWSAWLPCDRIALSNSPAGLARPSDTSTAAPNGWSWEIPLSQRTLRAEVSASSHGPEHHGSVALRAGRRAEPWVGNVLALGDAAVAPDPLHGTGLHLAHSAILRALELLPGRDMHPLELHEYNRRTRMEHERVRDFLALHYLHSGRRDSAFWRDLADRAPPQGLARTLEQFLRRGRLPFFEEESFAQDSWLAALLGLGVVPRAIDPLALAIDPERAHDGMTALARRIAALPDRFPPYQEMLARLGAQSPAAGGGRRISAIRSEAGATAGKPFSGRSR